MLRLSMTHNKIFISGFFDVFFQLFNTANHDVSTRRLLPRTELCSGARGPNWQGRCPETVSAYSPVGSVFQNIQNTAMFQMRRYPVYIFIRIDQLFFYFLDINKPRRKSVVY